MHTSISIVVSIVLPVVLVVPPVISLVVSVLIMTVAGPNHLVLMHYLKQLLENVSHVGMVGEIINSEASRAGSVDCLVLLEVRLVDGLLDLNLPDLLDLVEVDEKRLWGLVAHKSKDIALLTFLKPDIFDVSKLLEQLSELSFAPSNWKVFDEEIAPLLGDLVLECLSLLLDLSICPLHSVADIQPVVLGDLLVVENFDCTCGAPWPIPEVILIWIIIAHESELADVILSQDQRLDGTELLEESLDLVVAPVEW
jgi:hypothetical protein